MSLLSFYHSCSTLPNYLTCLIWFSILAPCLYCSVLAAFSNNWKLKFPTLSMCIHEHVIMCKLTVLQYFLSCFAGLVFACCPLLCSICMWCWGAALELISGVPGDRGRCCLPFGSQRSTRAAEPPGRPLSHSCPRAAKKTIQRVMDTLDTSTNPVFVVYSYRICRF